MASAAEPSQPTTHPQYTFYTDEYQRRFTPTSATLTAMSLSQADWRFWKSVFNSLERDRMTKRFPQRFMQVDQDTIPDALRYDYYMRRLNWDHYHDDGRGLMSDIEAIRDRLMRPRQGLRDHLIDADLLYLIAAYFSNNAVAPPSDYPLSSDPAERNRQMSEYWRTRIRNYAEAERIYQYIVDHFDPDYAVTQNALQLLAFTQAMDTEKYEQAIENYKRFDRQIIERADKTFSVDRFVVVQFLPELISADKQLKKDKWDEVSFTGILLGCMIDCASNLPPERAIEELNAIRTRHPQDVKKLHYPNEATFRNFPDSARTFDKEIDRRIEQARLAAAGLLGPQPPSPGNPQ